MCTFSLIKKRLTSGFLFITILFLALACSKSLVISQDTITLNDGFPLNYSLTQAKYKQGRKLLIIVPDAIDTTQWLKSSLVQYLFDENYQILRPKIKGVDFSQQVMLDQYEDRVESIRELISGLHKNKAIDTTTNVVVLGMGDGAYITPKLAQSIDADGFILVNSGPYSFIHELELLLQGDTTNPKMNYLKAVTLLHVDELDTLFKEIRNSAPTMKTFLGRAAGNWTAYSNIRLAETTYFNRIPGLLLYEPHYPFLADSAAQRFTMLTNMRYPKIDTLNLKTPLFKQAPLDTALLTKLQPILSTR